MSNKELKGSYICDFICDGVEGRAVIDYDYSWLERDSLEYNHDLARFCSVMTIVGYDTPQPDPEQACGTGFDNCQPNLTAALRGIGFEDVEINPCGKRDEMSYFFGRQEIELNDGTYNFVLAALMGSYKRQWFSNFDPYGVDREANNGKGYAGDDERGYVHLGFADARDYIYQQLTKYFEAHPSEHPTKLLLIGHSRGASAANMLAAKLLNNMPECYKLEPKNMFTYCLATPNGISKSAIDDNPDYQRIINIVSPEDFVTHVFPEVNGFGKYGRIFRIMGDDNRSLKDYAELKADMQQYYREYVKDHDYHPFKKGNSAVEKVTADMAASVVTFDDFYDLKMRECFKSVTPFTYFKSTLCAYIAGGETDEEKAASNKAMYLLLASSVDLLGTSYALRKISGFFVFREGLGFATGNKIGATYFSDSHRPDSYTAYLLSINEDKLIEVK